MPNCISGCKGAAGIREMMVTKDTRAMPSQMPAGDDRLRLRSRGLTWARGMSTGTTTRLATMWMPMRRNTHRKPMMDQHTMYMNESTVGLSWEPVMWKGMRARMLTTWLRSKKYRKLMIDQPRNWRTEGKVQESVKIGQYISDL
jgi:hypothetical protein